MTKSEVVPTPGTEIGELSDQEKALLADQDAEYAGIQFNVPLLKIGQALTTEVQDGDAKAGDFINALTGDSLGSEIEFIVAKWHNGRFRSTDSQTYVTSSPIVPDTWTDKADVPHIGRPFAEHPDAQEQYSARANAGDIEWGHGPPIQSTVNFTGYALGHDVPVRLSLKSSHRKVAQRWVTLIRILRAPWDAVFTVSTFQDQNSRGEKYYVPAVKTGRPTTAEERSGAVDLAQQLKDADTVREVGGDQPVDPAAAKRAADKAEAESGALGV